MARQLKNSDTASTPFGIKYGSGSAGDKIYSSNTTLSSTDQFYNSRCTGSSAVTTGSTPDLADGTYNLPCKIVQTQGTGANATPNWEYNFLISVLSGIATFKYPLSQNWNTGAQIVTSNQWRNVTINNGIQLTVPAWNGSYGGEFFLAAAVSITGQSNNGQIVMDGAGFRGGNGGGVNTGSQGEGTSGAGGSSTAQNANGAGGGGYATDSGHVEGGNGGGGGNAGTGQNGSTRNTGTGGPGGAAETNSDNSTMVLGGGGSSAGRGWNDSVAPDSGANGAGNAQLLAPTITGIVFYCRGNGTGNNSARGCGGAGAGGNALCQGQNVSNVTFNLNGGTGGTCSGSFGGKGGDGGVGQAQIDYSGAAPSSITGTYNSILTPGLANTGGAFIFLIS